jgi:preprotein translocase subunit SecA
MGLVNTKETQEAKGLKRYKSAGIMRLREMALADNRMRHPDFPELARSVRSYSDRTANGLTKCIIDYLNLSRHQAERINSSGRPIDRTKIVTDVLGSKRRIGSMKWIPGAGTKGTADISATINGRSVKIEVKMKDRQSPDQKRYEEQVIRAGGLYWIVRSFEEFLNRYNELQ